MKRRGGHKPLDTLSSRAPCPTRKLEGSHDSAQVRGDRKRRKLGHEERERSYPAGPSSSSATPTLRDGEGSPQTNHEQQLGSSTIAEEHIAVNDSGTTDEVERGARDTTRHRNGEKDLKSSKEPKTKLAIVPDVGNNPLPSSTPDELSADVPSAETATRSSAKVKKSTAVKLVDYDKEFPPPSLHDTPSQDTIDDITLGIREKKARDHKRMMPHTERRQATKSNETRDGTHGAHSMPDPGPSQLGRMFKRDYGPKYADIGEERDELQSSITSSIIKDKPKIPTPSILDGLRQKSRTQNTNTAQMSPIAKENFSADIPPTQFLMKDKLARSRKQSVVGNGTDADDARFAMLDAFVNGTIFEEPIGIILDSTKEQEAFFLVSDKQQRQSCISTAKIRRVQTDRENNIVLFTPRSEQYPEGKIYLRFCAPEGLAWFLRGLAERTETRFDAETPNVAKMITNRLSIHTPPRKLPREVAVSAADEQKLLERRTRRSMDEIIDRDEGKEKGSKTRTNLIAGMYGTVQSQKVVQRNVLTSDGQLVPSRRMMKILKQRSPQPGEETITYEKGSGEDGSDRTSTSRKVTHRKLSSQSTKKHERVTRASENHRVPSPKPTRKRVGLGRPWSRPLVYPQTGRNKATVEFEDLRRLDEDEFLNDNLVEFCLRWCQEHNPGAKSNVYVFNTYFYSSLTKDCRGKKFINYDAVKKWTSKIDLFKFDYIVVPINENFHWYVAIICNLAKARKPTRTEVPGSEQQEAFLDAVAPPSLTRNGGLARNAELDTHGDTLVDILEGQSSTILQNRHHDTDMLSAELAASGASDVDQDDAEKESGRNDIGTVESISNRTMAIDSGVRSKPSSSKKPDEHSFRIITFDSFGLSHSIALRNLREYLAQEAETKYSMEINYAPGSTAKEIPLQKNFSDCGLYLGAYIDKFLQDPAVFMRKLLQRQWEEKDWTHVNPVDLRNSLRITIQQEYWKQNPEEKPEPDEPLRFKPSVLIHAVPPPKPVRSTVELLAKQDFNRVIGRKPNPTTSKETVTKVERAKSIDHSHMQYHNTTKAVARAGSAPAPDLAHRDYVKPKATTQAPIADADEQEQEEEESSANTDLRRSRASTEFSGVGDTKMDINDTAVQEEVGPAAPIHDDFYTRTAQNTRNDHTLPTKAEDDKEMLDVGTTDDYISLGNYDEHDATLYTHNDELSSAEKERMMPDWAEQLQHAATEPSKTIPASNSDAVMHDAADTIADAGTQWAQELDEDDRHVMEVEDQVSKGDEFNGFPDSPSPTLPPRTPTRGNY